MSRKKRERLEVIYEILKIISDSNNSIRPTPLLRRSNLSSSGFYGYYHELIAKGFIKEADDSRARTYVTLTDKGFAYLEKYRLILGFISEFEL